MISFSSNIRLHNDAKPFNYLSHSSYARAFSSKSDDFGSIVASGVTGSGDGNGNDWVEKAKDVVQTSVNAVAETAKKTKDVSDEMIPHVQQFLDSNPYLKDVIVPVSLTVTGTLFAWIVMPRILRRFHTYAMQSSAKLLPVGFSNEDIPYEKSFWGALEDPARYLVTFIAFAQIAAMVAPTTIAAQYFSPTVKGAVILSVVWFLYRWKTNVITRMLSAKSFGGLDRDKVLTLDKVSSVGLFAIGLMASAEACGVAVQSILTVEPVFMYANYGNLAKALDFDLYLQNSIPVQKLGRKQVIGCYVCVSASCQIPDEKTKKSVYIILLAASVTGVLGLVVAIALFLQYKKRHRNGGSGDGVRTGPMDTTKRYYKYSEVVKVTNNFERVLGQGGFGKVYHGVLNDDQVAVKILSESSAQGYEEFRAEVTLLYTKRFSLY
ncbi:unnamed protein product [Arabidopsis thaliana]|uniref:(thale cress) hypothetical protein n=1 Tax=Arabidopsis thaliana TaxID=3702 RepID=A0A7G2EW76_ARATH|nr:unnamed protein product [Arabidopsis thaliana]